MLKKGNSRRTLTDDMKAALICRDAIDLIRMGKEQKAMQYLSKVKSEIETEAAETRRTRRFSLKSFYNWRWQRNSSD